jgi:dolichol-phosphate mannosyltransferase
VEIGRPSLDLSIVIPVFNEEENVETLAAEIDAAMRGSPVSWECIWVDDQSTDGTFDRLARISIGDRRHGFVRLAEHEGQSAALAAGFSRAWGGLIATLDGDGQSDPADVPRLVAYLRSKDLDLVNGRRENRRDGFVRKASSKIANAYRNRLTGENVTDVGCSLRVFRRGCVEGLFVFKGMHRFLPTLIRMNGYDRIAEVAVRHRPRLRGRTKYGIRNRVWVGIADTFAIRWMRERCASARVESSSMAEPGGRNGCDSRVSQLGSEVNRE